MFFPSTSEKVLSDEELHEYRNTNEGKEPDYLSKPTIICCNPNALFYHHMVNSPNKVGGGGTKNHTTLTYQFIDAFPTNITALPLSYEGSTITKTTINFSYSRYIVMSHKGDNTSNSRSQVGSGNVARDASQEALQTTIKAGDNNGADSSNSTSLLNQQIPDSKIRVGKSFDNLSGREIGKIYQ